MELKLRTVFKALGIFIMLLITYIRKILAILIMALGNLVAPSAPKSLAAQKRRKSQLERFKLYYEHVD